MTFDPNEQPKYRVINEPICIHSGIVEQVGRELTVFGWLPHRGCNFEPLNEAGKRILAYQIEHMNAGDLPGSPMDSRYKRIFLPWTNWFDANRPQCRSTPRDKAPAGMPLYRVTACASEWRNCNLQNGDVIGYGGWPMENLFLEPVNDEARQVAAYWEANSAHPQIPPAPWCCFHLAIFLPELPKIVRSIRDGVDQYEEHRENARLVRQIVENFRKEVGLPAKAAPPAESPSARAIQPGRQRRAS